MTENDQEILESLAAIIPNLTHIQKEKLLSFGEGLACANNNIEFFSRIEEMKKTNIQQEKD